MDITSLSKDVVLLIIGGLVTYFVTLAISKTQTPKPSLAWRLLPPVFFPTEKISSFNLAVENDGNKDAENVRIVISLPKEATIVSFELQVNEKAAKYEIARSADGREIAVTFPFYYKKLEAIFAFLAKDLDPADIDISIVGNEVIGTKKNTEYSQTKTRVNRTLRITTALMVGLTVAYAAIIGYMYVLGLVSVNYSQQIDIAQVFFEAGKPDMAIDILEEVAHYWWVPSSVQVNYLLASAYATKNDVSSSIFYLRRASEQNVTIVQLAKTDRLFDGIRSEPDFINFINDYP